MGNFIVSLIAQIRSENSKLHTLFFGKISRSKWVKTKIHVPRCYGSKVSGFQPSALPQSISSPKMFCCCNKKRWVDLLLFSLNADLNASLFSSSSITIILYNPCMCQQSLAHLIITRTMSWYMHKLNIMSCYLYIIEHENNNLVHSFYFVVRLI